VERGGGGVAVVEQYSDEWFPRPVSVESRPAAAGPDAPAGLARQQLWIYVLAVAALALEWVVRRRRGLR
jgi:hypothetical protein